MTGPAVRLMASLAVLAASAAGAAALLPAPQSISDSGAAFICRADTVIVAAPGAADAAAHLASWLRPPTGYELPVLRRAPRGRGHIELAIEPAASLGAEGYRLQVDARRVRIAAARPAGLFYGIQTLRQLFPPAVFSAARWDGVEWSVPGVTVEDVPRLAWRGVLVDVARHFMPKGDLYRFIDAMSALKLNRLQLHLTDNQAWRIQIPKYPQLSAQQLPTLDEQNRKNCNCGLQAGSYSGDDLRQIVSYASARHITVIPEIEIPGHAGAAIAAMPEMGNLDANMPAEKGSPYRYRVFSPHEKTILFLEDVLDEVIRIFPSELIHIGGDEVRKDEWARSPSAQARMRELGLKGLDGIQSYMVARMQKHLASRGRRLIGWHEIMQGGLSRDATVLVWGLKWLDEALAGGYPIVLGPTEHTYFDYYQTHDPREPRSHHYYLPLRRVYEYDPVPPSVDPVKASRILGVQGQLWTTYMPTPYHMEYMAFPRLAALAEVAWTPLARKDYAAFKSRLLTQQQRWTVMGINYRPLRSATEEPE